MHRRCLSRHSLLRAIVSRAPFQVAAHYFARHNSACTTAHPSLHTTFSAASMSTGSTTTSSASPTTSFCVVYLTTPSQTVAEQLSEQLVQQRLVACVNVLPAIQSVYRWKGEVCKDSEVMLLCKTRQSLVQRVAQVARKLKYAECPEVIATPIVAGTDDYLRWIEENTIDAAA